MATFFAGDYVSVVSRLQAQIASGAESRAAHFDLACSLAALVLQGIAVYVPFVERVFGTAPLSAGELLTALAVSASVWVVGEGEKIARRALHAQPARR